MTQEEKAKAYDEALERARKIHCEIINNELLGFPGQIEDIFPQLSESEDERIRKHLIEIVETYWGKTNEPGKAADLAWLEKQKETLHDSEICKENADSFTDIKNRNIRGCIGMALADVSESRFKAYGVTLKECLAYLEKQKEPVVDKEGMYYYLGGKFIYCGYPATEENPYDFAMSQQEKQKESLGDFIGDIPYSDQKDQVPYIDFVIKPHEGDDNNPYDMRVPEAHEYAIKRGFDVPFNYGEVYVDERHLTQTIGNILRWADEHPKEKKPEWSEEDEEMRDRIIDILNRTFSVYSALGTSSTRPSCPTYKDEIDWLKSLRPQPKQEWSEADEVYLQNALWCVERAEKSCKDGEDKGACWSAKRWLKSLRPSKK